MAPKTMPTFSKNYLLKIFFQKLELEINKVDDYFLT